MLRTRVIATTGAVTLLSAVFATVLTFANRADTFVAPTRVVPGQPAPVTLRIPWQQVVHPELESSPSVIAVPPIVRRGQVVDDPVLAAVVEAYETDRRPPHSDDLIGLWFIYFLILLMLTTYLHSLSSGRGALVRTQIGLLGLATLFLLAAKLFLLFTPMPAHALPVATVVLWVALFLERRTALIVALVMAFLTASLAGFSLSCVSTYLASGITAVLALRDRKPGLRLIAAGMVGGVSAAGIVIAAAVIFEGSFDLSKELADPMASPLLSSFMGSLFAGVIAYIFSGFTVVLLGAVSRNRLLELSELDQPLLRKMATEAPGSWEHSRAMANLAEAATNAIGADALLIRVGAYYHDLGKSIQPKFFVENLEPGETSPHDGLAPDTSADAIMAHVVEGVNILRRGGIPEPVIEFAYTHHGTSVIEYFWHKCLEKGNPDQRDESFFRYPGMRPRTKETAILMIVDAVEAASRTVQPPERDKFIEMVQRIIFVKLRQGQLDESGLTIAELRIVGDQLVDSLCSIHHSRIRYPWQDKRDGETAAPLPGVATEQDVARALEARTAPPSGGPISPSERP